MAKKQHHEELIQGVAEQMGPVLEKSEQAIYIYLDDNHKVCNKNFADLLGYKSPVDWANIEAPLADVLEDDQQHVINAYMNASKKMAASAIDVRVKNIKTGKIVKTRMIMAPVGYAGHVFIAHFLSRTLH